VASARFLRMHPTSANQFLKQGDAVAQERVQRACYASPSCCIPWVRTVQLLLQDHWRSVHLQYPFNVLWPGCELCCTGSCRGRTEMLLVSPAC